MDLASRVDLAAIQLIFPLPEGKWYTFGRYYLPKETSKRPGNESYLAWEKDGWIKFTEGSMIDFDIIEEDIKNFCRKYQVHMLSYDPYQATMLISRLMKQNIPVIEYRQTVLNFSEPMKQLEADILSDNLLHDGNPAMSWMMGNVVASTDAKENVFPRKSRNQNKIDGPVALIMSRGVAMAHLAQGVNEEG